MNAWPVPVRNVFAHGLTRRLIWVLFAIVFYQSGLTATVWLIEPENFRGGVDWLWLALFPALLPLFFIVNRLCGCATGTCPTTTSNKNPHSPYPPPP